MSGAEKLDSTQYAFKVIAGKPTTHFYYYFSQKEKQTYYHDEKKGGEKSSLAKIIITSFFLSDFILGYCMFIIFIEIGALKALLSSLNYNLRRSL